jgi:hypothetical protein
LALAGLLTLLWEFFSAALPGLGYYTALYQWALNVESARKFGDASQGVTAEHYYARFYELVKPSKKE